MTSHCSWVYEDLHRYTRNIVFVIFRHATITKTILRAYLCKSSWTLEQCLVKWWIKYQNNRSVWWMILSCKLGFLFILQWIDESFCFVKLICTSAGRWNQNDTVASNVHHWDVTFGWPVHLFIGFFINFDGGNCLFTIT